MKLDESKISRKTFLEQCGGVLFSAAFLTMMGSIFKPSPVQASVQDNLPNESIYFGASAPGYETNYVAWLNTTDGLWYYRKDRNTTEWKNVSSVWS